MDVLAAGRLARRAVRRSIFENLHIRGGPNWTLPNDIRATLTERCNYRCVYCDHWRQDRYTDEMSVKDWKAALLSVRELAGRFTVQFLGGEPTMIPWFFDLARFCHESRIGWGVVTNGSTLTSARAQKIVEYRPQNIDISLDSRVEGANDYLRGVAGAMRKVSGGVDALVAARAAAGTRFPIRIKSVVSRHNLAHLQDLVRWTSEKPGVVVDFSPVRLWRSEEVEALYPVGEEEFTLLNTTVARLQEMKAAGAPIETSAAKLQAIIHHFKGAENTHGVGLCRVGLRSIDIRPNGDVNHCWMFSKIGNLREQSMASIWQAIERRDVVERTMRCDLFKTTCSTSCLAHRRLRQDIARGLQLVRAGRRVA